MTITRRDILTASAALAAWAGGNLRLRAAPLPRDVDVLVIGAGAAGIAAARRVLAANRKVMIVEATDHSGGRCLTDTRTFGVPFDRGARWLYQPDTNAVAKLARGVTMDLAPTSNARLRIGRRNARASETEDFLAALVRANRGIADAARGRVDVAAAAALPKDLGDWANTLEFMLGPAATSKDLADISVADLSRAEPHDVMAVCRQGLGALVAKLGEAVPVALSTPVTRIEWGGRNPAVETSAGRIAARAIIVTASTAVLTSGNIKFTPELPKRQQDAAAKLGLGHYDHIVLELSGNPLNLQRDDNVIEQSDSVRTATLVANISGSSLCSVDVSGSFGRELAAEGEAAMVQFAIEWLVKLYGSDVKAAVQRSTVTRWATQPYVLGAMSVAAPGATAARKILMEPLGGLFFAGEAVHETQWGTVGGAWDSGERAADAALARLGSMPEPEQRQKPRRTRSKS